MEEVLTLIEKTAFLSVLPALAAVPTEALAQFAAQAREVHYDEGDTLFTEGEPNKGVFLVVDGSVQLRKGSALVRAIGPRQGFGELFSKVGAPHVFTAIAIRHTHTLNITLEDVNDAMLDLPEFAAGLVRVLAKRNEELVERMLELERVLRRYRAALTAAGIEPPDAGLRPGEGLEPSEDPR